MLQVMLRKLQIRTQFNIPAVTILTAFASTRFAFALRLCLSLRLRYGHLGLFKLFKHHGVRHPSFDTDQRQAQKTQSRDDFTVNRTEEPVQAMGALARLGDDDIITRGHHDLGWLPQMGSNEQPLQATPAHGGVEKALDRPITSPFASPARQA